MEPVSNDKPQSGDPPDVNKQQGCAGCTAIIAVGMIIFGVAVLVGAIDNSPSRQYSHHEIRQNPSFFLDRGTPEFHPSDPNLVRAKRTPLFERKVVYNTVYHTGGERLAAALLGIGLVVAGFWICGRAKKALGSSLESEEISQSPSRDHKVTVGLLVTAVLVALSWGIVLVWNNTSSPAHSPQKEIAVVPDYPTTSPLDQSAKNNLPISVNTAKQSEPTMPSIGGVQIVGVESRSTADPNRADVERPLSDRIQLVSTDGRMIEAKILALSKTTIIIKRDNGQQFEIPLDRISAESRTLIEAYRESKRKTNER